MWSNFYKCWVILVIFNNFHFDFSLWPILINIDNFSEIFTQLGLFEWFGVFWIHGLSFLVSPVFKSNGNQF